MALDDHLIGTLYGAVDNAARWVELMDLLRATRIPGWVLPPALLALAIAVRLGAPAAQTKRGGFSFSSTQPCSNISPISSPCSRDLI